MASATERKIGGAQLPGPGGELRLQDIESTPVAASSHGLDNDAQQQVNTHTLHNGFTRSYDWHPLLKDGASTTSTTQDNKKNELIGGVSTWRERCLYPLTSAKTCGALLSDQKNKSSFYGWRIGVLFGCCMSFLVLCCNISLLAVGAVQKGGYSEGGVADLIYGDEGKVTRLNTAFHVLVNVLSSFLLAGSNYTMQVISSPTRSEIDKAHCRGDWIAIGLLSLRNWKRIARKRMILCLILGLSSIPLHLFYNAAIFKVITHYRYTTQGVNLNSPAYDSLATNSSYVRFSNAEWKSEFASKHTSGYTELIVVFDEVIFNTTLLSPSAQQPKVIDSFSLDIASGTDSTPASVISIANWLPYRYYWSNRAPATLHIAHAFAIRAQEQSRIQLSLYYMVIVIMSNLLKLLVMLVVLITDRSEYIVTLGDAVASFMSSPDSFTEGRCLLEDEKILRRVDSPSVTKTPETGTTAPRNCSPTSVSIARGWQTRRLSYFALVRGEQAKLTCLAIFLMTGVLIGFMATNSGKTWSWGTASEGTLSFSSGDNSASATLFNSFVANTPQVLLSFCYMNLNSFCTAIASAREWNNFGPSQPRKGLRVSEPRGQQRSTYFLQLPYRWSLPLIVASTLLHWLLSQTFFLIRLDIYRSSGFLDTVGSRSACGVSTSSFIVFFLLFVCLCIAIRHLASRKFVADVPQAASNSLVISAACHPPTDEIESHWKELQWGVVEGEVVEGFQHCSLSSRPVTAPEEGKMYY